MRSDSDIRVPLWIVRRGSSGMLREADVFCRADRRRQHLHRTPGRSRTLVALTTPVSTCSLAQQCLEVKAVGQQLLMTQGSRTRRCTADWPINGGVFRAWEVGRLTQSQRACRCFAGQPVNSALSSAFTS